MVPEDLAYRLAADGVDVAEIARGAVVSGFAEGPLFRCDTGAKTVAVWLE